MNATDLIEAEPVTSAPPRALATQTPADLIRMAVEQGADLDRLERLMGLQIQWERREAEKAANDAFASFKAEAIEIIKRKRVHFESSKGTTDYRHAELSDVIEAVAPALSKHGFSWGWQTKQTKEWIEVTCTLKHRLGHSESVTLGGPPDESGNKNPIQRIASTVTYLERYTLKAILGVSEKGDDSDAGGAPPAAEVAAENDELLLAGRTESLNGTKALTAWWGSLTAKQRGRMNREFGGLRIAAKAADERING